MVFVNKMDIIGADFFRCVEEIKTKVGGRPVCIQLPIGSESDFKGVIDLVRMKAVVWEDEALGAKYSDTEIPEDLKAKAEESTGTFFLKRRSSSMTTSWPPISMGWSRTPRP